MNAKVLAVVLGLAFAASISGPSFGATNEHLTAAVKCTLNALEAGRLGDSDGIARHAEEAIRHAKASEQATPNEHTKQGIQHLSAAVEEGKKDNAEEARKHVEEALTHLTEAGK